MSIQIVLQQMIIIFILIFTGAVLYRRSLLSDLSSKQISGIIVNLCNPALLISSAFDSGPKISGAELMNALLLILLSYAILIAAGYFIPAVLHVPKQERYAYRLLTLYGNVGFIGIPLASAVLGPSSLIFVSLNNLVYNILIYTHGIATIKNAAGIKEKKTGSFSSHLLNTTKKFINAGTVSAVLTIVLYMSNIPLPQLFSNTLNYVGRSTTFLSMLVLGVSAAQVPLRDVISNVRLYFFALLRMILIPALCIFLFRLFTQNELIISTTALMLAVPAGNMPLILSRQHDLDSKTISQGILLSTILSLITIPIVALLIASPFFRP